MQINYANEVRKTMIFSMNLECIIHLTPMHNFTDITMTQTDPSQNSAYETDTTTAQHRLQARLQ